MAHPCAMSRLCACFGGRCYPLIIGHGKKLAGSYTSGITAIHLIHLHPLGAENEL